MQFLKLNGLYVPTAIPSLRGNLIEEFSSEKGTLFYACCFEFLHGVSLERTLITPELIKKWGELVGSLHRLSIDYRVAGLAELRPEWLKEDNYAVDEIGQMDPHLRRSLREYLRQVGELPREQDNFGLIHADVRPQNMVLFGDQLGVYDFDGSIYSWYLHDISISLFSVLPLGVPLSKRTSFASGFLSTFLSGYRRELTPNLGLISNLNLFLKLEEMGEFILALRREAPHRLLAGTGRSSLKEWTVSLGEGRLLVGNIPKSALGSFKDNSLHH